MKKIFGYITILLLLLLQSCNRELSVPTIEGENAQKVTFHMGLNVPDMQTANSRNFGPMPKLDYSLWIVVFDINGYLVEYAKATNQQAQSDGRVTFDVTLQSSEEKRILHFILGGFPELTLDYGHESTVIGNLQVDNPTDVYWQRRTISKLTQDIVVKELQRVPLVRNFAQLGLDASGCANFTLKGYCLVHPALQGTVAPYKPGLDVSSKFVEYQKAGGIMKDYSELVAEGYRGHVLASTTYEEFPDSPTFTDPSSPSYLYEHRHEKDAEKVFSVLLKGRYVTDTSDSYYKVDLVNTINGIAQTYDIFRNFKYIIKINKVIGSGKATAKEAYENPANNNLSSSVLIKNLNKVSDGTSVIYVSYTDTVLVSTNPVQLKYKFVEDIKKPNITNNKSVKFQWKAGPSGVNIFKDNIVDGNFTDNAVNNKAENDWATLTLTPEETMPMHTITQSLVVYQNDKGLSREVVFELRPELQMEVECQPYRVPKFTGSDVTLNIKIPNHLNKNLFPMLFRMEAQETGNNDYLMQYISPKQGEPIYSILGNSLVEGFSNARSFHYEKVLPYEEYKTLAETVDHSQRIFPCGFVTNKDISASTIYVDNKYFTNANCNFINTIKMQAQFTKGQDIYGKGHEVLLSFTTDTGGKYEIVSPNGSLDFNSVESTSGASAQLDQNGILTVDKGGDFIIHCRTQHESDAVQAKIFYNLSYEDELFITGNERKINLSAEFISGQYSYGTGQDVIILFKTNAAGEYKLSSPNSSLTFPDDGNKVKGGILTMEGPGEYQIKCKTALDEEALQAEISLNETAVTLSGEKRSSAMTASFTKGDTYYGKDKKVILTFKTNAAGKYKLTSPNNSLTFPNKGKFTAEAPGEYQIECTTKTWSKVANVRIVSDSDETKVCETTGGERNIWKVKLNQYKFDGRPNDGGTNVTLTVLGRSVTDTWRKWIGISGDYQGVDVTVENLTKPCEVTLTYTQLEYDSGFKDVTYKATTTVNAIQSKEQITFVRQ